MLPALAILTHLDALSGVVGPDTARTTSSANGLSAELPTSYLDVAGLPTTSDMIVDPRSLLGSAIAVYGQQNRISALESVLTATVVSLKKGCTA